MGSFDELIRAVTRGEGIAIAFATALLALLFVLTPRGRRRHVRAPLILLVLYVAVVLLRAGLGRDDESAGPLGLAGLFFVGMSVARSGFLLAMVLLQRRLTKPLPKIFQDLVQASVFGAVILVVLRAAGAEPSSLLTTSALLTAVVGLSLQDTLGNMFAGLAIQAQRPFEEGDWIRVGEPGGKEMVGRVSEMNWRAITVRTLEDVEITVPNGLLAKQPITNFHRPTSTTRREAFVYAPLSEAPGKIETLVLNALVEVDGVVDTPAPTVIPAEFSERGVRYWVRYHIVDLDDRERIEGRVRARLWYALSRAGISIPAPMRQVALHQVSDESRARELQRRVQTREQALRGVDFLEALPAEALRSLAEQSEMRLYAPGEVILREADAGDEFFIVDWGEVSVSVRSGASEHEVARLKDGTFFGEMSVMTGESRRATVRAIRETELQVVKKRALEGVLREAPELAETISSVLARRNEELAEDGKEPLESSQVKAREHMLLDRIKRLFSL